MLVAADYRTCYVFRGGLLASEPELSSAHGVRIGGVLSSRAPLSRHPLSLWHPAVNESAKSRLGTETKIRPRMSHPRDNQPHADEGGASRLSCASPGVAHLRVTTNTYLPNVIIIPSLDPRSARERARTLAREGEKASERG